MKIQDIMTRDPASVTPEATVREAAQIMLREDVGIVPVVAGPATIGWSGSSPIATSRFAASPRDGTSSCKVRDAMSSGELTTCRSER